MKLNLSGIKGANPFKNASGFRAASSDGGGGNGNAKAWAVGVGFAGAAAGGIGAYEISQNAIHNLPAHTVTVTGTQVLVDGVPTQGAAHGDYATPIMGDKVIGQAAQGDFYSPNSWFGWAFPQDVPVKDVHASDYGGYPQLDANGKAVLVDQSKTFQGHGNPVLNWDSHTVQAPYLDSSHSSTYQSVPDQTYHEGQYHEGYSDPGYYDRDGNYHSGTYHSGYNDPGYYTTNGYWVHVRPNVHQAPVQTENGTTGYQTPNVNWDTGVHTALNTVLGALGGFGLAALATYFIKSALSK